MNGDFTFTLARNDELLLTSGDWNDAAEQLLDLGVHNPLSLVKAAEQWGVVDIHEELNPRWIGG